MAIVVITLKFETPEGEEIIKQEEVEFNYDESGTVCEIEYYSPSNGGPVMRPKRPRI